MNRDIMPSSPHPFSRSVIPARATAKMSLLGFLPSRMRNLPTTVITLDQQRRTMCWRSAGRAFSSEVADPMPEPFATARAIVEFLSSCALAPIGSFLFDTSRHLITIPSRVLPCSVACLADQGPAVPRLALTFRGTIVGSSSEICMRRHGPPRTYLIMTLVGILLTAGKRDAKVEAPEIRPVRTVTATKGEAGEIVVLTGHVQARDEPALAFRIGGRMIERTVSVGDRVEAGQ